MENINICFCMDNRFCFRLHYGQQMERDAIRKATRESSFSTLPYVLRDSEYQALISVRKDGELLYCADINKKKGIVY